MDVHLLHLIVHEVLALTRQSHRINDMGVLAFLLLVMGAAAELDDRATALRLVTSRLDREDYLQGERRGRGWRGDGGR